MRKVILTICMCIFTVQMAFAASIGTIHITGKHTVDSENVTNGRHTFVLTAQDNAPMPADATGGVKKVTINSGESFDFGEISYDKPGIYKYTVSREIKESDELEQDDSSYIATVSVYNDESPVVVFEKNNESGKPDKIEYNDKFIEEDEEETKKGVKTGDETEWIMFMICGALACMALLLVRESKKNR